MKLAPFKLEREFAQYEFSVRWMASSSDAETMSVDELLALAGKSYSDLAQVRLGYSDSAGIPELRQAIAATYTSVRPDEVLCHAGAQEPIHNFFHACLSSGDHVVVHFPCYQSFLSLPESLGISVSRWEARLENAWQLRLEELEKLLRPNTRAIFVNFPHNPTGAIASREFWDGLISLVKSRGIILFSDEVYRGLEFRAENRLIPACDLYENAVSLGVLSKAYGLAGLRLGWVATHREDVLVALAGQKDYTTICNPILSEVLGTLAVENHAKIWARNQQIVAQNWRLLEPFLRKWQTRLEWVAPQGGTMLFPKFKADPGDFYDRMRENRGVFIVRGSCFEMNNRFFRLGIARKNFPNVLREWEDEFTGGY